ncbi:MAG: purine-nucleoside phosphorylase [Chloroflexi bacterium]|nr:MAG: purine-nucleoside phosphorylase [Phototrophicales bacterium]RMF80551.1 MAG: purine-nucleoside phosphorylase [Chloroflexota bacterium]
MAYTHEDYKNAVAVIRQQTQLEPRIGLVLGSGLGTLADTLDDRVIIPYENIPGWPQSTVEGHSGRLVIGRLEGHVVVAQQGRAHLYEGYTPQEITFPIRIMHFLGVKTLILTNAAGGLNTNFRVGDLMLLNDHINLVGMTGTNPLIGPNEASIGERFIGMAQSYDRELRQLARQVAAEHDITLHEGVYVCLSGPNFETPAEIRMLRIIGGDAVGMSTAHEVLVARHAGMRVMACSGITNEAISEIDTDLDASHEEVLDAGTMIVPKLTAILKGVLRLYQDA